MRRRLLLAAFLLDGLCTVGALVFAPSMAAQTPSPYAEVDGVCVERVDVVGADSAGRVVDDALCAHG